MTTTAQATAPLDEAALAKMLDRIHMLLAKAEASPYPAEAETFTEHAQRLMVRHGIAQAELDAARAGKGQPTEAIVTARMDYSGAYAIPLLDGMGSVAQAMGTLLVLEQRALGRLLIVGAASDVEKAKRLLESLLIQVGLARTVWWASWDRKPLKESARARERREFTRSFGLACGQRLLALRNEETPGGKELVLASRAEKARSWWDEQHGAPRESRGGKSTRGSHHARLAGALAGARAELASGRVEA